MEERGGRELVKGKQEKEKEANGNAVEPGSYPRALLANGGHHITYSSKEAKTEAEIEFRLPSGEERRVVLRARPVGFNFRLDAAPIVVEPASRSEPSGDFSGGCCDGSCGRDRGV